MKFWQTRTSQYFLTVTVAFAFCLLLFMLIDSIQSQQTSRSLGRYMENLRDMVFMSTYDSLKKGNMKLFKSHMEELGTFEDVQDFSLLDTKGVVHYSSDLARITKVDPGVIGLTNQLELPDNGFTTYYFPVTTTSYCTRCHADWEVGSINSYYKLILSRAALDEVEAATNRHRSFMGVGGLFFVAFLLLIALSYERRKREEQALLSDSVRNFMDSVDEPFLSIDSGGFCTFCNQAGLRKLDYDHADELLGRNTFELIQLLSEDGSPLQGDDGLAKKIMESSTPTVINEVLFWRSDGSHFVGECRVNPLVRRGTFAGATIIFHDATKRKAEELRTLHLSHLASLGELAAGVAHEINNPISGVINYAQLYKNRYGDNKEGQELLDRIVKEGNRIASIVNTLLNYAHQDSVKVSSVNLVDVVNDTLQLFLARLEHEGIALDINVGEGIQPIRGNFQNLEQVLMNLVSNSRYALNKKFPGTEHVDKILCIVLEKMDDEEWPHIRLTVFDHGIGIPAELVKKVMNPFITTKPAGDGTGLGLHICFSIVTQHNGRIHIDSEPGEFTRVTIDLPVEE